jgi:hypothetical protein
MMPHRSALPLFLVMLTAACAQLSLRQELTWDAYKECQVAGLSARLDRIQVDGGWDLTGREGDIYRVDRCMLEYWQRASRDGRVPALPASHTVTPVKAERQAPASQSQVRAASVTDSSTSSSSR